MWGAHEISDIKAPLFSVGEWCGWWSGMGGVLVRGGVSGRVGGGGDGGVC